MREGMEQLAEAVDRHRGELIAILFTHSHGDHIGDMDLLREAFDVPFGGASTRRERSIVTVFSRMVKSFNSEGKNGPFSSRLVTILATFVSFLMLDSLRAIWSQELERFLFHQVRAIWMSTLNNLSV